MKAHGVKIRRARPPSDNEAAMYIFNQVYICRNSLHSTSLIVLSLLSQQSLEGRLAGLEYVVAILIEALVPRRPGEQGVGGA